MHGEHGSSDDRRLDRNYEELELLNDKVRRLMLDGVQGAAELYRRNRELLKQCERSRLQKAALTVKVSDLTAEALRESHELLDRSAAAQGADNKMIDPAPEHLRHG